MKKVISLLSVVFLTFNMTALASSFDRMASDGILSAALDSSSSHQPTYEDSPPPPPPPTCADDDGSA